MQKMKINKILKFIFLLICMSSCENRFRNHIQELYFKGVILKIYNDVDNHNMYTFKIKILNSYFDGVADIFPDSWGYAEVGDSILKLNGELSITIKKKNGDSKIFYYQE